MGRNGLFFFGIKEVFSSRIFCSEGNLISTQKQTNCLVDGQALSFVAVGSECPVGG